MSSFSQWVGFEDEVDEADLALVASQFDTIETDDDEEFARSLQFQEFSSHKAVDGFSEDSTSAADRDGFVVMSSSCSKSRNPAETSSSMALSDPQWELIDPTPNIHRLFIEFDQRFFWGELAAVEVGWSKRMTTCAGICYYSGRRSGYCRIGLSEPLLKLRARKELVETLIHEMIHAYLFVTHNNKDHDGHGDEFHRHMRRINQETGLAISVYHTFHDEVAHYKRHWWRCDGPCRNRPPFHGFVKRASNRAPSKNDLWWADHQRSCGGNFVKVKEPEGYAEKQSKKRGKKADGSTLPGGSSSSNKSRSAKPKQKTSPGKDIRSFLFNGTPSSQLSDFSTQNMQTPAISFSQPSKSTLISSNLNVETPEDFNSSQEKQVISQNTSEKQIEFATATAAVDKVLNSGAMLRKIIEENRQRRNNNDGNAETALKNKNVETDDCVVVGSSKNEDIMVVGESRTVACPVCGVRVSEISINFHLDSCLS